MTLTLKLINLMKKILIASKVGSFYFFAENLKRPYFAQDIPNYGKAYHKALTNANAYCFVIISI